ncbi:Uncharacterised protein [Ewingella americana]|jgi:hypothetical protein|uniref:Uncharacterized protein n=1 Tax=Ewingella americana TaxID=41202 RepID=A0A377NA25_9GAMM|nr:Uncharacterised protein [Ewingella americana]
MMGQYFKPVPVPAGLFVSCGQQRSAFTCVHNDVKLNPPFSGYSTRSFPCTLRTETFTRPMHANQGGLSHVC